MANLRLDAKRQISNDADFMQKWKQLTPLLALQDRFQAPSQPSLLQDANYHQEENPVLIQCDVLVLQPVMIFFKQMIRMPMMLRRYQNGFGSSFK